MVMHARKPQRIGDGYFEKHQAHPYQNSKYSSKNNYDRDRTRSDRDSPNGNSYRSDSPDCDSPRERGYHSKQLYIKTRERDRDRDYKRDKYSDCLRSPKDKRRLVETDHRTNHDRNSIEKTVLNSSKVSQNSSRETSQRKVSSSCQDKREDRDRVVRCGDWSEHVSSSGKKYYYNCKTEVSQWEKPREWLDAPPSSRHQSTTSSQSSRHSSSQSNSRTNITEKHSISSRTSINNPGSATCTSTSNSLTTKLLNNQSLSNSSSAILCSNNPSSNSNKDKPPVLNNIIPHWSNITSGISTTITLHDSSSPVQPKSAHQEHHLSNNTAINDGTTADMEICSAGDSTPRSVPEISPFTEVLPESSVVSVVADCYQSVTANELVTANAPGPPILENIHLQNSLTSPIASSNVVTTGNVITTPTSTPICNTITGSVADIPDCSQSIPGDQGPPTPTHSESQDCQETRKMTSPPNSLSSLTNLNTVSNSSLAAAALRPQAPSITPVLASFYREDLVPHIQNWAAELLEKQASKNSEEEFQFSLLNSRVSAELKCARSIVRQTEIQATLYEQRQLFLEQQISKFDELKANNMNYLLADES